MRELERLETLFSKLVSYTSFLYMETTCTVQSLYNTSHNNMDIIINVKLWLPFFFYNGILQKNYRKSSIAL